VDEVHIMPVKREKEDAVARTSDRSFEGQYEMGQFRFHGKGAIFFYFGG
jgi:hypothetical protein